MSNVAIADIPSRELRFEMPERAMFQGSIPKEYGFKVKSWQRREEEPTGPNQSRWTVTVELEGKEQTVDLKSSMGSYFITVSSRKLNPERGFRDIYLT